MRRPARSVTNEAVTTIPAVSTSFTASASQNTKSDDMIRCPSERRFYKHEGGGRSGNRKASAPGNSAPSSPHMAAAPARARLLPQPHGQPPELISNTPPRRLLEGRSEGRAAG